MKILSPADTVRYSLLLVTIAVYTFLSERMPTSLGEAAFCFSVFFDVKTGAFSFIDNLSFWTGWISLAGPALSELIDIKWAAHRTISFNCEIVMLCRFGRICVILIQLRISFSEEDVIKKKYIFNMAIIDTTKKIINGFLFLFNMSKYLLNTNESPVMGSLPGK